MADKDDKYHELIDDAAEEAAKAHPGHLHDASKALLGKLSSDPRITEAMIERLLLEACTDRIRRVLQRKNQQAWHNSETAFDPTSRGGRLRRAIRTSMEFRLMDYTLIGGKPLGIANRAEVLRNAEFQSKQATRMGQTATWLTRIAAAMPEDDKTLVRDVLTEEKLRQLQADAKEAA